ncbi:hypothetical protein [Endozoicomonas sp. 4G]|uniref:hypothetical protein n=1 Tax=Endozoicomonas sp. 4G TaxID=2872754 RepID=UPI002078EC0A|nr:hypothetical protein [Endozoicomonas sp. 4G]
MTNELTTNETDDTAVAAAAGSDPVLRYCQRCEKPTERYACNTRCKLCHKKLSRVKNYQRINNDGTPLLDCLDTAEFEGYVFRIINKKTGQFFVGSGLNRLPGQIHIVILQAKQKQKTTSASYAMVRQTLKHGDESDLTIEQIETEPFTLENRDEVAIKLEVLKEDYLLHVCMGDPLCLNNKTASAILGDPADKVMPDADPAAPLPEQHVPPSLSEDMTEPYSPPEARKKQKSLTLYGSSERR